MKQFDKKKKKVLAKLRFFVSSFMKSEACSRTTVNYASHITPHASMEFTLKVTVVSCSIVGQCSQILLLHS